MLHALVEGSPCANANKGIEVTVQAVAVTSVEDAHLRVLLKGKDSVGPQIPKTCTNTRWV